MDNPNRTLLNGFSKIDSTVVAQAAASFGTPFYLYDEAFIIKRCRDCLKMPNPFGLTVRFAMKANTNRSLLRIINGAGLHFDASSLNEVLRAQMAGIPVEDIMLTTQEVYEGEDMAKLQELLLKGLHYNVCSLRQLHLIGTFSKERYFNPGIRIHPGVGSGESASRNTGDEYSCFGVHLSDLKEALDFAWKNWISFKHIHVHIGSGADIEIWRQNIDLEMDLIEKYFSEAETVGFGGGIKEARMPDEQAADIMSLGNHAQNRIEAFRALTRRKLKMEIEPGTFIVANSGYAVTKVLDKKHTNKSNFVIINGGMEINSRPLLYGSKHPIYIVSGDGSVVKSSEFGESTSDYTAVIAGRCCESGDCQTLEADGRSMSRRMAEPEIGDFAVIGGAGAYCSSMTPFNYNSHTQVPEVLYTTNGELRLIRKRQTLEQMLANEI